MEAWVPAWAAAPEFLLRAAVAGAVAVAMAWRGLKRGSLAPSGAVAAAVVGFLSLAASWRCGLCLLVFYFSSSWATRLGEERKARLEDEHRTGGQRDAVQVLTNSAVGVAASLLYAAALRGGPSATFMGITGAVQLDYAHDEGTAFWACVVICFFAACNGDTWSSEIGILSKETPVLVTNPCRAAPPGTNGAITLLGTLAAAAAGAVVGVTWIVAGMLLAQPFGTPPPSLHLVVCLLYETWVLPMAMVAGVAGSLLDSLLGATLQASVLHVPSGRIMSAARTRQAAAQPDTDASDFKLVAGVDVLSNEGVNLVASALAAVAVAAVTRWMAAEETAASIRWRGH